MNIITTNYEERQQRREAYCQQIEAHCHRLTERPTPDLMPVYREARVMDPELAQLRREILRAGQKKM